MDFFVDHSGFFLSVGVIMLLALIGYYADRDGSTKGKQNNNVKPANDKQVSDNVDNSVNENRFINNVNYDSLEEKTDSIDGFSQSVIPDTVNSNISENLNKIDDLGVNFDDKSSSIDVDNGSVGLSSQEVTSFEAPIFENIGMSLDELERKNYDNIANKANAFDDSDNYYYSNLDDSEVSLDGSSDVNNADLSIETTNNETISEVPSNQVSENEKIDFNNSNVMESLDLSLLPNSHESFSEVGNVVASSDEVNSYANDSISELVEDNSNDVSSSDVQLVSDGSFVDNSTADSFVQSSDDESSHQFDNEVSFDDQIRFDNQINSDTDGLIPELFTNNSVAVSSNNEQLDSNDFSAGGSIVDSSNSSSSEDIWKF